MIFIHTKVRVSNRGVPPDSFLTELVTWGRNAPVDIFASNLEHDDIYVHVEPLLGPWHNPLHRRAALLEVMRVHAGLESSWHFGEGVDTTNKTSMREKTGEETGVFQVSFDSTYIRDGYMRPFAVEHGITTPDSFIPAMKSNHNLAFEYYARLVRVNVRWAGPIIRHEIDPWLSRSSVNEFELLLS
jgi:hypothetical protein